MSSGTRPHTRAWAAGLLTALAAGLAVAAQCSGRYAGVYGGGAGGLAAGLAGWLVALRMDTRHRSAPRARDGRWDVWSLWAAGLALRLALAVACAAVFWFWRRADFQAAMLSLAAVYLVLLLAETAWLYRRLLAPADGDGIRHG